MNEHSSLLLFIVLHTVPSFFLAGLKARKKFQPKIEFRLKIEEWQT
jgi:hypothetical protein